MKKLTAEASKGLPAPVEKAIITNASKQINDRSRFALRLREGDIINRLCLAE
jgi:hypothetical protein